MKCVKPAKIDKSLPTQEPTMIKRNLVDGVNVNLMSTG